MPIHVDSVRRFPLKGAMAEEQDQLEVNTRVGVANDRRLAVRSKIGDVNQRPEPFRKTQYEVCINNPAMAIELPQLLIDDDFTISEGRLTGLAERIGVDSPLQLHDTHGDYHLCDTAGAQVSFLNLATVRAFEEFLDVPVDPDRFRMNVWVAGLPAFAEYDWVNGHPGTREIMIGSVRLRVDDACERCKATHANPQTGEHDLDVVPGLKRFMEARGYKSPHRGVATVMGIYAVVLNDGVINPGDEVRLT